ncbi:MAG: radical SAM protein [Candidatus Gracilibacteria bacterium]|nr:radical SAM protein [Candidatus Gracilibacteria bacterium]MDD2908603.1 radical SAM protein [Candidatus Gracilibacteria bacterium]
MDLRIVNTCNNNCCYCLEQSYRDKPKYINKEEIFLMILEDKTKDNITFYGGNPLLHPDLPEIIIFCKSIGYENIGILTNTYGLTESYLSELINLGLKGIGFYFNTFNKNNHELIVNGGINLDQLLENIQIIKKSGIFYKAIIHVNKQNIETLFNDVYVLNKKYLVNNFEFVNYFPFDRPYDDYKKILEYSYVESRIFINKLFIMIIHLKLNARFTKFSKDFFDKYKLFYNFDKGILEQIYEEDILRLKDIKPFCLRENRCYSCFIKDNCKFHKKG